MSRDVNGAYTLPAGNPVITGTTISSTVHNNTMDDLASEMSDSLSRSGKGGMTAELDLADGAVGSPGLRFTLDPDSGLYRIGSNNLGVAVGGSKILDIASTGLSVTGNLAATGNLSGVNLTLTGTFTPSADIPVADGGTGASNAADARTNLGLVIGTNVQAYDADLAAIAALSVTDGNFIVGNGTTWVAESGATARTSLGLAIGTDVQAYSAALAGLADPENRTATDIANISPTDLLLVWDDSSNEYRKLAVQSMGSFIEASATQTLALDDSGKVMVNTGASDHTVTVPPNSDVAFPIGTELGFVCQSTGNIILAQGSGVTIVSINSYKQVKASGGGAYLIKTATNTWSLVGDLEA